MLADYVILGLMVTREKSKLLVEIRQSRSINGQPYSLTYQYDAASNLVQLTYPDGYVLGYTYDALNRITAVGSVATITYRKNNELAAISYGNGVQTAYSYDQLGRNTRIHTWNSTMTLLDLNYAYDSNGNPTSLNGGQEAYGYDDLNRLTSANGPFGTITYSYDQVGNRLTAVVNGTTTNYSYGPYNRLLSAGSTTYSYDNNGNMIAKTSGSNSWTYAYDFQNRLKQVSLDGQAVFQAVYDGDGRRIETIAGSDTIVFHYHDGSWDPVYTKDLSSGVTIDVIFVGSLRVGKIQGGTSYYYHLDRLGSVRLVTQSPSVQTFVTKYLPYGNPYATSGLESFQFTGKQLDVSSGLYYYGYRYYDAQSGRFITPDIQPPNYSNPQSLNRYPYALNNPNRYSDPDGRGIYTVQYLRALKNPNSYADPDSGPPRGWGDNEHVGVKADRSVSSNNPSTSASGGHEFSKRMLRQISLQLTGLPPGASRPTTAAADTSTSTVGTVKTTETTTITSTTTVTKPGVTTTVTQTIKVVPTDYTLYGISANDAYAIGFSSEIVGGLCDLTLVGSPLGFAFAVEGGAFLLLGTVIDMFGQPVYNS